MESKYFGFKEVSSFDLLALVDAHCRFITIDVGSYGRNLNGDVFATSKLCNALKSNLLNVPQDTPIKENGDPMAYVILGDEAFPLISYLMKLFSRRALTGNEGNKIFNDRLFSARCVVNNAFEMLSNRWKEFKTEIIVNPENANNIILAACCLHNMLIQNHDFKSDETDEKRNVAGLENMDPS